METRFKVDAFVTLWQEHAEAGRVDGIGGAEFCRVLAEWIDRGCPCTNLREWITREANEGPIGRAYYDF